jgi:flagellar biosynthesis/type III secretory pathway M-ring protein FliF/YscJ
MRQKLTDKIYYLISIAVSTCVVVCYRPFIFSKKMSVLFTSYDYSAAATITKRVRSRGSLLFISHSLLVFSCLKWKFRFS